MRTWQTWLATALGAGLLMVSAGQAMQKPAGGTALTEQDRADIQDLVARYAKAMSACAADDYADLFAGYFGSSSRGQVATHDNLAGLVRSERACVKPNPNAGAGARRPPNGPSMTITATPEGAAGKIMTGTTGGYYDDTYVKTPKGWRFKSRNVISAPEAAAKMTLQDFIEIRRLAGDEQGRYADTYVDAVEDPHEKATPGGGPGRQFRASGLVITVSPEAVTGRAFLKNDGGHYDDVYVKTGDGWRFKSRTYVPK